MTPGPLIGVFPVRAHVSRTRLFAALEQSFSVRFEGRRPGEWNDLDAALVFGDEEDARGIPAPSLVVAPASPVSPRSGIVELATAAALDRSLRGRRLAEGGLAGQPGHTLRRGDAALALSGDVPVWVQRGHEPARWWSALAPRELSPGEGLRDQLRSGRFLGLLPLVHFLRQLAGDPGVPPRLRACFVIDDPNIHAPRYGHIQYLELLRHAVRHGYHIAMASVPLDHWLVHRRTAELFRTGSRHLSLTVHGNNHEHSELSRFSSDATALAAAAQALRRVDSLERRTSVRVSRVMCAPHEECSPAMLRAMFRVGFEALALDPRRDRNAATRTGPLGGWAPSQLLDGGFPVLPRYGFPVDEDLVFRAYLDLPLILYGHHQDLAGGLDVLADAAERVNSLGDVDWLSLGEIATTNRIVRSEGTRVTVQLLARRSTVSIPPGTWELIVELPASARESEVLVRCGSMATTVALSPSAPTRARFAGPFADTSEIYTAPVDALSPSQVGAPRARLRPVLRRLLTEGRDRIAPIVHRPQPNRA